MEKLEVSLDDWGTIDNRGVKRLLDSAKCPTDAVKQNLWCYQFTCLLCCLSHVQLFATLWTIACQAPLSMGFSRKEYWSGLPGPPPGDLLDPGIKPTSLTSPALAGGLSLVPPLTCLWISSRISSNPAVFGMPSSPSSLWFSKDGSSACPFHWCGDVSYLGSSQVYATWSHLNKHSCLGLGENLILSGGIQTPFSGI